MDVYIQGKGKCGMSISADAPKILARIGVLSSDHAENHAESSAQKSIRAQWFVLPLLRNTPGFLHMYMSQVR